MLAHQSRVIAKVTLVAKCLVEERATTELICNTLPYKHFLSRCMLEGNG